MKIKEIQKYVELYDTTSYLFKVVGFRTRKNKYLSFDDFYRISMWKSARPKQRYIKNKGIVEEITKKAFLEKDEAQKMRILCELKGINIPTASAILSVVYPKKYPIIDIRCLEALKDVLNFEISKHVSLNNWLKYLVIMRDIAKENNIIPRELDMALFAIHKEKLEKQDYKNLYNTL